MANPDYTDFVHTGPGTLAGRYLRRFWHPVSRAEDLAVGRAVPIRVMSEDFTLYRGESGAPHVVAFRCAHRGTQLSTGWVEGDCLRCLYHGWKYDASGQCVEQPGEDEGFAAKVRIRSRSQAGLVRQINADDLVDQLRWKTPADARAILSRVDGLSGAARIELSPDWAPRAYRVEVTVQAPK